MSKKTDQKLQKILVKIEDLSGQIKDLETEVEQIVLGAYDDGCEDGYKERDSEVSQEQTK